jgi:hypothetical protein
MFLANFWLAGNAEISELGRPRDLGFAIDFVDHGERTIRK